jgi:large subunit ribosomal protein L6
MSRIGRKLISVPAGVKVQINASTRVIDFQGPKGKLSMTHRPEVKVTYNDADKSIVCEVPKDQIEVGNNNAYWGTTRSVINGMVEGVLKGYEKKLEIVGVGWGAKVQGKKLVLAIGFANAIEVAIPANLNVVLNGTLIEVSGPNKQAVGAFASDVRACRKPEPYNGKGIKYTDEVIQRKQGKAFGS